MEDETVTPHSAAPEIRDEGRRLFASLTRAHRETRDELVRARQGAEKVALAGLEAFELVEDTVAGLRDAMGAEVRQALEAALSGASEQLRRAGIDLDGAEGEVVDPSRHRVVKSTAPSGLLPNRVKAVWRSGARFRGQRIRQAEVVGEYVKGSDGADRN